MVFALFKGCRSDDSSVALPYNNTHSQLGSAKPIPPKPNMRNMERRESTANDSLASDQSKATLLESYAIQAKWDAAVRLVSDSCIEDWVTVSTSCKITTTLTASSPSAEAPSQKTASPLVGVMVPSISSAVPMTHTPLHIALQHGAPVHVIDSLIQIMKNRLNVPVPEEVQDEEGRTPLHVAVVAGCEEGVVQRLLDGDNLVMPAVLRDDTGQTPLHAACASPVLRRKKKAGAKGAKSWKANQYAMDHWNKRRVIDILVDRYPEACGLTDGQNKTPLTYAVDNKLQRHVVHEMREAAETWCKSENAPTNLLDNAHVTDLESLANTDVPMVVPSIPGSTNRMVLTQESIARLDQLLQEDWTTSNQAGGIREDDDVSTLGDDDCMDYTYNPDDDTL